MMNPVTATNKERFPCKSIDEGILNSKGRLKDSLKTDLRKFAKVRKI
jgi:hypothetical protein